MIKIKHTFYVILHNNREYDLFAAICKTLNIMWGSGCEFTKQKIKIAHRPIYIKIIGADISIKESGLGYYGYCDQSTFPYFRDNFIKKFVINIYDFYKMAITICSISNKLTELQSNIKNMKSVKESQSTFYINPFQV